MLYYRETVIFGSYFETFYLTLPTKEQDKILWTLRAIRTLRVVPNIYLKAIINSSGLYEVRSRVGTNTSRVFCFYADERTLIICNGFKKKSQRIPRKEIEKAERIKSIYYESIDPTRTT